MNLYFIGRGIVLKGIVKYYGSGKNIPRTFGHTGIHKLGSYPWVRLVAQTVAGGLSHETLGGIPGQVSSLVQ